MTELSRRVLNSHGHVMITVRQERANVSLAVNAGRNIPVTISPDEARELAAALTRFAAQAAGDSGA